MAFTYCVWYRLRDPDEREAETLIRGLLARVACRTGVAGQLLKKCDAPNTWMELYTDVAEPQRFEATLAELAERYDLEMFLADGRHVECFRAEPMTVPGQCSREGD